MSTQTYYTPPPGPAPPQPRSFWTGFGTFLEKLGPYVGLALLGLYMHWHVSTIAPAPAPDKVKTAATAWRKAESGVYLAIGQQLRSHAIAKVGDVEPAMKALFTPPAKQLTDALNKALKDAADSNGLITDAEAAATAFETAGKAVQ